MDYRLNEYEALPTCAPKSPTRPTQHPRDLLIQPAFDFANLGPEPPSDLAIMEPSHFAAGHGTYNEPYTEEPTPTPTPAKRCRAHDSMSQDEEPAPKKRKRSNKKVDLEWMINNNVDFIMSSNRTHVEDAAKIQRRKHALTERVYEKEQNVQNEYGFEGFYYQIPACPPGLILGSNE
ncbi:MAG: hypothetical protein Q9221_007427 [Calogaya cf. arnoldii]